MKKNIAYERLALKTIESLHQELKTHPLVGEHEVELIESVYECTRINGESKPEILIELYDLLNAYASEAIMDCVSLSKRIGKIRKKCIHDAKGYPRNKEVHKAFNFGFLGKKLARKKLVDKN